MEGEGWTDVRTQVGGGRGEAGTEGRTKKGGGGQTRRVGGRGGDQGPKTLQLDVFFHGVSDEGECLGVISFKLMCFVLSLF
jgi:hypothetical protein